MIRFPNREIRNSDGKALPEIQIMKSGEFVHWSGKEIKATREFFEKMLANFNAMKTEAVDKLHVIPVDYNHGSLEYGIEEAKASGWISELSIKDESDGECALFARVSWTPRAAKAIEDGEYLYISATFSNEADDEYGDKFDGPVLWAAALTNRPFLKGMAPVHLNSRAGQKSNQETNKMKEKLIQLFQLSEDADEKAVLTFAEKNAKTIVDLRQALNCKDGDVVAAAKALMTEKETLNVGLKDLTAEVTTLKAERQAEKFEAKFSELVKSGKIAKAKHDTCLKLFNTDPALFEEFTADLRAPVEFGAVGSGQGNGGTTDDIYELAKALAAKDKIDFRDALHRVQIERPELAASHRELHRAKVQ